MGTQDHLVAERHLKANFSHQQAVSKPRVITRQTCISSGGKTLKYYKHLSTAQVRSSFTSFLTVTITNTSLHLIQRKQDYTQLTNKSAGGKKINQRSKENEDLLHQKRIKGEWCVLTICICAEAAAGGWFVSLSLSAKLNHVCKSLINLYLKKVQMRCDAGFCACTNNDKANNRPQMLSANVTTHAALPILPSPTAVGNSGEYRLIITRQQAAGAGSPSRAGPWTAGGV